MLNYRKALTEEFDFLKDFIFKHGSNPWNYLPEDAINKTFALIADNHGEAVIACEGETIVGVAIFFYPSALPESFQQYTPSEPAIYIAEVVVHGNYSGRGVGSQ